VGETPEQQQRRRGREAVADEQRLVQQRRPVERGAEPGDGGGGQSEETVRQHEGETDPREPDQHLADEHSRQAILCDPAETREDVGIEGRLRERPTTALPALPDLDRRDRSHPRRIGLDRVAAEDVPFFDATRPCPVDRHVALGPRRLELGHRMIGHPPEVDGSHGGGEHDHEE
jgi:hypothetical protein